MLRVGIIEALTEANQRKLLDKLTFIVSRPGTAVPVAVVALEGECGPDCWHVPKAEIL